MLLPQSFAVIVLSLISLTLCQQPTVPVIFYPALPENTAKPLGQHPRLREFAVRRGSRIYTEIKIGQSVIIAEEGVNVNIDCLPLLGDDPTRDIRWFLQRRNESGDSKSILMNGIM